MRAFSLVILCMVFGLCGGVSAAIPGSFNVRDFGAKGDGVSDDTRAIQAAADAAMEQEAKGRLRVGPFGGTVRGTKSAVAPEVYFPKGEYLVSDTVVFQQSVSLRGEESATIRQKEAGKDVFYFHYAFRCKVEGLAFEGGAIQLRFWTGNIWSRLLVENCRFRGSSSDAIECLSFTAKRLGGENWNRSRPLAPYEVKREGERWALKPNPLDEAELWYNSTLLSIKDSEFDQCARAFSVSCDTTYARDLKITTSPETEGPMMRLGGQVHLHRIQGRARVNPDKQQFWAEVTGNAALRESEFISEGEVGMPLLRSRIVPVPTFRGVRLEKLRVQAGGGRDEAIVIIGKGTMPSLISISEVEEVSGKPVAAVKWEETPTLDELKDKARLGTVPLGDQYKIVLGRTGEGIDRAIPAVLEGLLEEAVAPEKVAAVAIPWSNARATAKADEAHWKKSWIATEHGVRAESGDDQSDALEALFAKAAEDGPARVILPGGTTIYLSRSIALPEAIRIESRGVCRLVQKTPDQLHFVVSDPLHLEVENVDFVGGKHAFLVTGDPAREATMFFGYCSFFDQTGAAVAALAGGKREAVENGWSVRMEDTVFRTFQALVTNASRSFVAAFWGVNDPHLDRAGFFENHGGAMRIDAMLGNPHLWIGERSKRPPEIGKWDLGRDVRWFDNAGRLQVSDSRFGGESGGICNVYHRVAGGSVYISGGMTRARNSETRPAIVYAEAKPESVVLRDISAVPGFITPVMAAEDAMGAIWKSGVLAEVRPEEVVP